MVISFLGGQFFKVSFGDTTLAFNPISKQSKLKQSRFGADIALISVNHPDFNGVENVTHGGRTPFVIDGPGEYEVRNVTVHGLPSVSHIQTEGSINTIYLVTLEGMRLCFLGALSSGKLGSELIEAIDGIDILFISIAGGDVLNASDAHELSVKIGPHIVIPMQYDEESLKKFLKEEGIEKVRPIEKLTLKKKDLEGKEGEIVVFK